MIVNLRSYVSQTHLPTLLLLIWLTVGHVVIHWYANILFLVLPFIKNDLDLSNVQIGTITTASVGVTGILTLLSGYIADSFRKQVPLILAVAILTFGLAYLVIGTFSTYPAVLTAAGLTALGSALWHPAAIGSLSLHFPERRGMALSVHGVGASIGDSLAPIAVGAIISVVAWRVALQAHLVPTILVSVLLWKGLMAVSFGTGQKPSFKSYTSGISSLIADRQVLAIMGSNALIMMARLSVLTFLPIYVSETLGYSSVGLGVYLSLLYLMGTVSQPVMGSLSDNIGRKYVMIPSFVSMGLLYMSIPLAAPGFQLGLVITSLGLFFYAILNINQSAIMDVAQENVQSSTMGLMGLSSQPFTLASPVLAGYLVTGFGIEMAFWYPAAITLLAAIMLIPIRFRRTI